MCKKSMSICMVLVAVFGLFHTCSAELVGHWSFDDGAGAIAVDSSGNGHDAVVEGGGDSAWVEGQLGDAVEVGNGVWVNVPPEAWAPIDNQFTVAFWSFGYDGLGNNWGFFATAAGANRMVSNHIPWGDGSVYYDTADAAGAWQAERISKPLDPGMATGVWNHWAFTKNADTGDKKIYLNGELWHSGTNATGPVTDISVFTIGSGPNGSEQYLGVIDDFQLYDVELTQEEIQAAMIGQGQPFAFGPDPEDDALHEATWVNISWKAGDFAVSHDVYLGDNFDDVNSGAEGVFQGNLGSTSLIAGFTGFAFPDGLVPGTTYYWRVDEVNDANVASPWKGDVWSFWVPSRTAYGAVPADEAQFLPVDVTLEWTAGFNAKLHTVYFGDNFDEVGNASGGVAQTDATFSPGMLELDKTYYWRVDEFDPPATHKGDVWSFTTLPDVPIADPALMGWWTFEEGTGTTAVDWSGQGRHGMFVGEPQWVAGYDGGAVEFDGSSYVDTGYTEDLATYTIACWVKSPAAPSGAAASGPLHREQNYQFNWNHGNEVFRGAAAMNAGGDWRDASYMPLSANRWYHLAATYDGTTFNAYRDGVLITSRPGGWGAPNAESGSLKLGRHATAAGNFFTGTVDEARVYNRALTAEEIVEAMNGDTSIAWSPNPGNGTMVEIGDALPLSWSAGDSASQHDVYFGSDKAAVANADASDGSGIYRGRQGTTTYNPPEGVAWGGGPYYWRVDESNTDGTIGTGKMWTFTVTDYLIVDDFESYNDIDEGDPGSNRIYLTWIDGFGTTTNGSQAGNLDPPFMSQGRESAQAMPLSYDNAGKTSEATMTLVSRKDWTEQGVTKLVLWFSGDSANAADRMYVALGNAIVYHPDDAATQDAGWNEWVIDLQEFANQGADLTNVGSITIGFGTRNAPVATGGIGTVEFDDIGLVR